MQKINFLFLLLLLQLPTYGQVSKKLNDQTRSFIENKGQIRDQQGDFRDDIDFYLQSPGMTLFIGNGQLQYQYIQRESSTTGYSVGAVAGGERLGGTASTYRLEVHLEGCNPAAKIIKESPRQATFNYYTGNGSEGHTGIRSFGKITYKDIYPSIDWVVYTKGGALKYDFVVHPGGKVSDIHMLYGGATKMERMDDGSLLVHTPMGTLTEAAPYTYELTSTKEVKSAYVLEGHTVRFQAESYEGTLVIDPGVEWATYFGGEQGETAGAQSGSLVIDSSGHIFITSSTSSSTNIATTGAFQVDIADIIDCFVAKFDSTGNLIWSTYYGGTNAIFFTLDISGAIDLDGFGNLYLSGITNSTTNMSTPGSFQPDFASEDMSWGSNGFLAKFDAENGMRKWGTYYGAASLYTHFNTVKCDHLGNVYVAGNSDSSLSATQQLVTTGAHQSVYGGGDKDALLVKFDSSGNRLWATYYGGHASEYITTLDIDEEGSIYIGGDLSGTMQADEALVTENAFDDNSVSPTINSAMGFVAKFSHEGVRQWGTLIRGYVKGLELDKFSNLYVAGYCANPTFVDTFIATAGGYLDDQPIGGTFGYLVKFDKDEGNREWGTFYGAESPVSFLSASSDKQGNIYVAGSCEVSLTPDMLVTADSYQDDFSGAEDGIIVKFDSSGNRKWASFLGGEGNDFLTNIEHEDDVLYVSGMTNSTTGLATSNAYQSALGGGLDAFLVRWLPVDIVIGLEDPVYDTACTGQVPLSVTVMNAGHVNKTDHLGIGYEFTGPSEGSDMFTFEEGLTIGTTESYSLGTASLPFEGTYEFVVYLQYTGDDNDRDNDTLRFTLVTTTAEPVAAIEVNQIGTNYLFHNPDGLPSYQYQWHFGDGQTSMEPSPTHSYEQTGAYEVMLIVTGYCGSDTAYMNLDATGSGSGIQEIVLGHLLTIYPNPASSELHIAGTSGIALHAYEVVNALGQKVLNGIFKGTGGTVNLSGLAAGTYYIKVNTDQGMANKPFQVMR